MMNKGSQLIRIKNPILNEDHLATVRFLSLASPTQILENVFTIIEDLQREPSGISDRLAELTEDLRLKIAVFAHKAGIRIVER